MLYCFLIRTVLICMQEQYNLLRNTSHKMSKTHHEFTLVVALKTVNIHFQSTARHFKVKKKTTTLYWTGAGQVNLIIKHLTIRQQYGGLVSDGS